MVVARAEGTGVMESYFKFTEHRVSVGQDKRVLEMDRGDGCTIMGICWVSLNCVLEKIKTVNCRLCVLCHNLENDNKASISPREPEGYSQGQVPRLSPWGTRKIRALAPLVCTFQKLRLRILSIPSQRRKDFSVSLSRGEGNGYLPPPDKWRKPSLPSLAYGLSDYSCRRLSHLVFISSPQG